MGRPPKTGREASHEALDYIDHWLSRVVDLMSEGLKPKQRHKLRVQMLRYLTNGDRRHSDDNEVQMCFEVIVLNFVNADETL